ncbi:GAF domain-containing protein, partial [Streptomyces sp. SID69]|nr:GAF domain-containing protein [Streptomyces sp. SID69]
MAGSGERAVRTRARLAALLANASVAALRAAGGRVAGVYLRADTPGFLRLAVLSGLPGPLFRPWWRVHVDRPLPVCDAYRLGLPVVLANATEAVRRYPQFAAALPFPFASVHMPVPGGGEPLGVLAVLRPVSGDDGDEPLDRELLARLAEGLGTELRALAGGDRDALVWDGEPQCVRPPAVRPPQAAVGRFTWDPGTHAVRADDRLHTLLGLAAGDFA